MAELILAIVTMCKVSSGARFKHTYIYTDELNCRKRVLMCIKKGATRSKVSNLYNCLDKEIGSN